VNVFSICVAHFWNSRSGRQQVVIMCAVFFAGTASKRECSEKLMLIKVCNYSLQPSNHMHKTFMNLLVSLKMNSTPLQITGSFGTIHKTSMYLQFQVSFLVEFLPSSPVVYWSSHVLFPSILPVVASRSPTVFAWIMDEAMSRPFSSIVCLEQVI
jgi:hypothetical protein